MIQSRKLISVLSFFIVLTVILYHVPGVEADGDKASLFCQSDSQISVRLEGPMGQRIENNVTQWVLRAPRANPALLSVFQLRDREPNATQYYVPWVGEFIGKFLTNAIMSLRMSDNPELEKTVTILIEQLIASQDTDGYMGPFPKQDRLLVAWDLWGHYHAITALLMWYERTGDTAAFQAACRAGDCVCNTFLDTGKRMKDVGSHEMNLSIITSLCQLYRLTGNERYFQMAGDVLKDWEDTGDYYRSGLAGLEFYQTPRPRWESIHCMLGLTELYQITGDESYRNSFMNLWWSARRLEMHNNGSFSTNEQTIGNPFSNGAIETCCTVAWMAMTVEALRLTGLPVCADTLELATFNAATSFQHPSGSWSTYDTPLNGRRAASFHSIVFQSRPGQPELNCCSVNAPRALGMITEWGVMKRTDESGQESLFVNYYGPGSFSLNVQGIPVTLVQKTKYPCDGRITLEIQTEKDNEFGISLRIPQWVQGAKICLPQTTDWIPVSPGQYYPVTRIWKPGDTIQLDFPMTLRYETGDLDFADRISVYRGPLLLAWDQRFNACEENAIPALCPEQLERASVEIPERDERGEYFGNYTPWLKVTIPGESEEQDPLVLVDFATAGVWGSTYVSLIPARHVVPPVPACDQPGEGKHVAPGAMLFTWRRLVHADQYQYTVVVSDTPDFQREIVSASAEKGHRVLLTAEQTAPLKPGQTYYWKVIVKNEFGQTESMAPGRSFYVDASLPALDPDKFIRTGGKGGLLISDRLAGQPAPEVGELEKATGISAADGPDGGENGAVRFDGVSGKVTYRLETFPDEYTLSLDFLVDWVMAQQDYAHLFSGWCRGGDDPLRVFITPDGSLSAAVEGSGAGRMANVPVELNHWYHLDVVKSGCMIMFYLDGKKVGAIGSSMEQNTSCSMVALGGNPLYDLKPEFFPGRIANFRFYEVAVFPEDQE